jgi:UDP-3-O-[3-hydroxymyristoyl] glucosamine N-acyltransferase
VTSLEIAEFLGAEHHGPDVALTGVLPLDMAGATELCFAQGTVTGQGGVVICKGPVDGRTCIVVEDPKLAFIQVLNAAIVAEPPAPGVHPTAIIDGGLGEGVYVGPYVVIGAGSVVADGAVVHAHVVIGQGVMIGERTVLHPHCTIYDNSWIGPDCVLHANTVIGSDGFSYHSTPTGPVKVPQVGRVILHEGVELGALNAVDRAFLTETVVGAHTGTDNMVHIGHNCTVGEHNLFAAQTVLGGSAVTGDFVVTGGQVAIADHAVAEDGVQVGGKAALTGYNKTGTYWGIPGVPIRKARRMTAALRRLPELTREFWALKRRMDEAFPVEE